MMDSTLQGYDIIGDLHGCYKALVRLLSKLGYQESHGSFQHPSRQAIFVGDLIDRGSKIRETLSLVKLMVDRGAAQVVMGNHEYNALCYCTKAPKNLGRDYLRDHNRRHQSAIAETLHQFEEYPDEWQEYLDWFLELPVFIETESFRVVHACWDDYLINQFKTTMGNNCIDREFLVESAFEGTFAHRFMDRMTRGTDMPLPAGVSITGRDGYQRKRFRTKFWSKNPRTYGDVVFQPDPLPQDIVEMEISARDRERLVHYGIRERPVFVGHYWLDGTPRPLTSNVACLDFSAVKAGRLVAYQIDTNEELSSDNFKWVYTDNLQDL